MREMRNAYNILVGNLKGRDNSQETRSRWKDNIRVDLREIGWEGVNWIHLVQDRNR
jgi:hypothetical protein